MPPDPRTYLWDARRAAALVVEFVAGKSWSDYESDALLRSAVERQFEIVGESLNQLDRAAPDLTAHVPDLRRIVAFRNVLIHGYASVDDRLVWEAATERAGSRTSCSSRWPRSSASSDNPGSSPRARTGRRCSG